MIVSKGTQPVFRSLEPGDPWTMIMDRPIWFGPESDGRAAVVGDMIRKWFATNEPGRIFRITAIHGTTYETVFVGFEQPPPGDAAAPAEPPRPPGPPRPSALAEHTKYMMG